MTDYRKTEEDVKNQFISPSIEKSGWAKTDMRMEYGFTDGRIIYVGDSYGRAKRKKADYILMANSIDLAIVEAKDENHSISAGLLQAVGYAETLNIPFAYSTNGHGYIEYDLLTLQQREISMDDFPTKTELLNRYFYEKGLTKDQKLALQTPYHYSSNSYIPRYYQKVAVDKIIEYVSKGNKRALLVMATGTGKTLTAFQLIWRLKKSSLVKKVLFLADRNILVNQPRDNDFHPLTSMMTKIEKRNIDTAFEIFLGLYQQLDGEDGSEPYKIVTPDFFDLIIVDECHRGSAREDSRWHNILEYFSSAIQVGMTATPKSFYNSSDEEIKEDVASMYFGKPVYTYSLKKGLDDGFLAPYKVYQQFLDIDVTGYRPHPGETDKLGNLLEDRVYTNADFDRVLIVDSRTTAVAEKITEFLKNTDRYSKTIVFCVDIDHAERLRLALMQLNRDLVLENPRYVCRITGDAPDHEKDLEDFIRVEFDPKTDPVIVTTSELMSTGVDCKTTKLIVLDKLINSMTLFKQIIGRGTRLRTDVNKYAFSIMDFRSVTRLFADPRWDGDIDFVKEMPKKSSGTTPTPSENPNPKYFIHGDPVEIITERVQYIGSDGKLTTESIIDYTKRNILNEYANLNAFINDWNTQKKRSILIDELKSKGVFIEEIRKIINVENMDDFDLICHIAFDTKPLTKSERAKRVHDKCEEYKLSVLANDIIDTLLDKYCNDGLTDIDDVNILKLDEFKQYGTPKTIVNEIFGGRENYIYTMNQIKETLYSRLLN
jgi:type I restriction enzyme R subunit